MIIMWWTLRHCYIYPRDCHSLAFERQECDPVGVPFGCNGACSITDPGLICSESLSGGSVCYADCTDSFVQQGEQCSPVGSDGCFALTSLIFRSSFSDPSFSSLNLRERPSLAFRPLASSGELFVLSPFSYYSLGYPHEFVVFRCNMSADCSDGVSRSLSLRPGKLFPSPASWSGCAYGDFSTPEFGINAVWLESVDSLFIAASVVLVWCRQHRHPSPRSTFCCVLLVFVLP